MTTLTNRQAQIIETSIAIIHEGGIQKFTIKNLSRQVGVTESAIYRHFKSKNDILCEILSVFVRQLNRSTLKILNANSTSIEKIEMIFTKLSSIFTAKPAYVSVIFAEDIYKDSPNLTAKVREILVIIMNTFDEIIKKGQKNLEITNSVTSKSLTLMIVGGFRLNIKNWKLNDFKFDLTESVDSLFNDINLLININ